VLLILYLSLGVGAADRSQTGSLSLERQGLDIIQVA
jgi:hypothetical protein